MHQLTPALILLVIAGAAQAKTLDPDPLAGTTRTAGFVDVYRDNQRGRVLIGVHDLDQPFLLVSSLPGGLGSNDIGLDHGQGGKQYIARFRRVGERLLLIADNSRFVAHSNSLDEGAAATDAFAPAVLWSGKILIQARRTRSLTQPAAGIDQDSVLADFGSFLASDRHGIAAALKATQQGDYALDPERSLALPEAALSFPDNAEFESLLTLTGPGEAEFVRQVAIDPQTLTLRQHISLVRLPPPGFQPRSFHPASGGFSAGQIDFAQALERSIDVRWHAVVDSDLRASLRGFAIRAGKDARSNPEDIDLTIAAERALRYLADPASAKLRALPVVPPGAPI